MERRWARDSKSGEGSESMDGRRIMGGGERESTETRDGVADDGWGLIDFNRITDFNERFIVLPFPDESDYK